MPARTLLFLSLFILPVTSCQTPVPDETSGRSVARMVEDDLGRPVPIPPDADRLISLAPNITEMLFSLGLGDQVVGVTSFCDYPSEATSIAKVGDTVNPNLERIMGLRPGLVLISRASQLEVFNRRLAELGIPRYVVDTRGLSDIPGALRRLGTALGRRETAEEVASHLEERIRRVEQEVSLTARPRVLLVIQKEPLFVPGSRSYLADVVRRAGGEPIGPDDSREGVSYSLESVIAQRPDVIILPVERGSGIRPAGAVDWPTLAECPAVKNDRVFEIDADLIMRPGPRLIDGFSELARVFHQE